MLFLAIIGWLHVYTSSESEEPTGTSENLLVHSLLEFYLASLKVAVSSYK
jgi:hypothetical protein